MLIRSIAGDGRRLAWVTLWGSAASGVYLTTVVLFAVQEAHLTTDQVGLGLGIAGLLALGAGVLGGRAADRWGAPAVLASSLSLRAAAFVALGFYGSYAAFVGIVTLALAAQSASLAARGPLIRNFAGAEAHVLRAYLRSVTNVGISAGTLAAGLALQFESATAYRAVLLLAATGLAWSVVVVVRSRWASTVHRKQPPLRGVLNDRPYVLLTLLDGVMSMQYKVLTVAVPLWIVEAAGLPPLLISVTFLVNTLVVVCFQVAISRSVSTPADGRRAYRRSGLLFLISCSCFAAVTTPRWPLVAGVVLLAGALLHSIGEILHAAGGFELSFSLAPVSSTGLYLGVFGMGAALADILGPWLVLQLCIGFGQVGWILVGALLAVTGAMSVIVHK